eukprot:116230_1
MSHKLPHPLTAKPTAPTKGYVQQMLSPHYVQPPTQPTVVAPLRVYAPQSPQTISQLNSTSALGHKLTTNMPTTVSQVYSYVAASVLSPQAGRAQSNVIPPPPPAPKITRINNSPLENLKIVPLNVAPCQRSVSNEKSSKVVEPLLSESVSMSSSSSLQPLKAMDMSVPAMPTTSNKSKEKSATSTTIESLRKRIRDLEYDKRLLRERNAGITSDRIMKLEEENCKLLTENRTLKAANQKFKRKAETSSSSGPAAKRPKAFNREKFFKKWGKALVRKMPSFKFYTCSFESVATLEEAMPKGDFDELFYGWGKVIQPTPENKPTSVITIRRFNDFKEIEALFGAANIKEKEYTCTLWVQGRLFRKTRKYGSGTCTLKSLSVHYNRSSLKLQLKFSMETGDPYDNFW